MIEGELLLAGVDWRTLNGPQFFSACEAVLARLLGGRGAMEAAVEEAVAEMQAKQKAAKQGRTSKGLARVLNIDKARRMAADADEYDREMSRGR